MSVKKNKHKSSDINETLDDQNKTIYSCGYKCQKKNLLSIKKEPSLFVMSSENSDIEIESVITVSPFDESDIESDIESKNESDDEFDNESDLLSNNDPKSSSTKNLKTDMLADFGGIALVMNKKSKKINKNVNNEDFNTPKQIYLRHMNENVEKIKKMRWGETITLSPDPDMSFISPGMYSHKHRCNVTKNVRFDSYIFTGYSSKQILKYFIHKTKDDQMYGYTKIIQILDYYEKRQFIPIRNWSYFWDLYVDEPIKHRHLFEMIVSDQPCKPYLDIEWKEPRKNPKKTSYSKFVNKLTSDIIMIFNERYNKIIDKNSIMISTSHSDVKVSFHVVIDHIIDGKTLVFRTNRKGVPESAWDLYYALITFDPDYVNVIDGNVYTTDREFRAIYSNKNSEFRPFVPYDGRKLDKNVDEKSIIPAKKNLCMRYLITSVVKGFEEFILTPEVPKGYLSRNIKQYDPDMYVPQVYTDKKIQYLVNLAKKVHPTAEYTGISCNGGWRFSYADKNEPCYTGNYHESNGFYLFENTEKGSIFMKCMSEQCSGIKSLEKKESKKSIKRIF